MTTQFTLIGEILVALCENQSFWDRCCCPDPDLGMASSDLLAALQTNNPSVDWTSEALAALLVVARRIGLVKQISDRWFIYTNFINVNPTNSQYAQFCPGKICAASSGACCGSW